MSTLSFFIAGTMQGSRKGSDQIDQTYREKIADIILAQFPDAEIRCPGQVMVKTLAPHEQNIRAAHAALFNQRHVDTAEYQQPLRLLTQTFHDLVDLAADSDICIAYLPNHEASMGTAAEMFAAHRAGKTVISITEMVQNLAIMSCSSIIIPGIEDLNETLSGLGAKSCA